MVSEVVAMEEAVMEMAAMVEECPGTTIPSPRNSSPTERIILMTRMISEVRDVMIIEARVVMVSEARDVMISEARVGVALV